MDYRFAEVKMARSYIESDLETLGPDDATQANRKAWALAYVRFATRDKPNDVNAYPDGSLTDGEIFTLLEGTKQEDDAAGGGDGSYYYFPHRVAASIIRSDPTALKRWSGGGYSEERVSPADAARNIITAGRWIEETVLTATSNRVGGQSLKVVL